MKEWIEHTRKAIFELSTIKNLCTDTLFGLIQEFNHSLFELSALLGGQPATSHQSRVVTYAMYPKEIFYH